MQYMIDKAFEYTECKSRVEKEKKECIVYFFQKLIVLLNCWKKE